MTIKIQVQREDFNLSTEIDKLTVGCRNIGAVISFTGLCRSENMTLTALEIEHYPGMAEAEIQRIANHVYKRWSLDKLVVIHRFGKILPGENIVLVITASKHRQAAFEGARCLMDFLKTHAPFWKKEHLRDNSQTRWVSAKNGDIESLEQWNSIQEPS